MLSQREACDQGRRSPHVNTLWALVVPNHRNPLICRCNVHWCSLCSRRCQCNLYYSNRVSQLSTIQTDYHIGNRQDVLTEQPLTDYKTVIQYSNSGSSLPQVTNRHGECWLSKKTPQVQNCNNMYRNLTYHFCHHHCSPPTSKLLIWVNLIIDRDGMFTIL